MCVVSLWSGFAIVMKTLGKSTRQLVKGLTADMKGKDFSEELGFMHEVKQEVR